MQHAAGARARALCWQPRPRRAAARAAAPVSDRPGADLYRELGLSAGATQKEVHRAFRQKAKVRKLYFWGTPLVTTWHGACRAQAQLARGGGGGGTFRRLGGLS